VKIGLFPNTTVPVLPPEFFGNLARGAEDRGFHSLWLPEHIVMFDELESRAPFSRSNNLQSGEFGLLDPLALDIDASNTEAKLDDYAESILEPARSL